MRIATDTVKINPSGSFHMVGYFNEQRKAYAKGINDDLLAVCLLLEFKEQILFISLDVLSIEKTRVTALKQAIEKNTGIKAGNIIISAIHTHAGPAGFSVDSMRSPQFEDEEYNRFVTEKIIQCVTQMPDNLAEATACLGATTIDGYYGNRNDITKPFDNTATLIRFMDADKNCIAALCNINCHSTVVGPQNMYATSDLLGSVRRHLRAAIGVTPYMFTGASADISNRNYRQGNDFTELHRVSAGIAGSLLEIHDYTEIVMKDPIIKQFSYQIKYDNTGYYPQYRQQLAMVKNHLNTKLTADSKKLRLSEKVKLEKKLTIQDINYQITCKIIDFGGFEIVTFPGELSSKFGLYLKNIVSKPVLIIGYADDHYGYFLEEACYGKCYETIASMIPPGESEKLIEKLGKCL